MLTDCTQIILIGEAHEDPASSYMIQNIIKCCVARKIPVCFGYECPYDASLDIILPLQHKILWNLAKFMKEHRQLERFLVRKPNLKSLLLNAKELDAFELEFEKICNTDAKINRIFANDMKIAFRSMPGILEKIKMLDFLKENGIPFFGIDINSIDREKFKAAIVTSESTPAALFLEEKRRIETMCSKIFDAAPRLLPHGGIMIICTGAIHTSRLQAHLSLSFLKKTTIHQCLLFSDYTVNDYDVRMSLIKESKRHDSEPILNFYKANPPIILTAEENADGTITSDAVERFIEKTLDHMYIDPICWLSDISDDQRDALYAIGARLLHTQYDRTQWSIPRKFFKMMQDEHNIMLISLLALSATVRESIQNADPFLIIIPKPGNSGAHIIFDIKQKQIISAILTESHIAKPMSSRDKFMALYPRRTFYVERFSSEKEELIKNHNGNYTIDARNPMIARITLPAKELTKDFCTKLEIGLGKFPVPAGWTVEALRERAPMITLDIIPGSLEVHALYPLSKKIDVDALSILTADTAPASSPHDAFVTSYPIRTFWVENISQKNRQVILTLGGLFLEERHGMTKVSLSSTDLSESLQAQLQLGLLKVEDSNTLFLNHVEISDPFITITRINGESGAHILYPGSKQAVVNALLEPSKPKLATNHRIYTRTP